MRERGSRTARLRPAIILCVLWILASPLPGGEIVDRPFLGVEHITRSEETPRPLHIHVVKIDLAAPGIRFNLTGPSGSRETERQTTLDFLRQEHAQIAINAHYFLPFPSTDKEAFLVGFAAAKGRIFSAFERPSQSYALAAFAPALNIDSLNRANIVHYDSAFSDGTHVAERVQVWNAVAGSAQIVTGGAKTIPKYADADHLSALLTPGGPNNYSNAKSWYEAHNARTAIGIVRGGRTLVLFTVDARGGSEGMSPGEVAEMLIRDYEVVDALNLDGGGSTTLAMEDPATHTAAIVNTPSDNPNGRAVGSNLAVFAALAKSAR